MRHLFCALLLSNLVVVSIANAEPTSVPLFGTLIRVSEYDPKDKNHEVITSAATMLCGHAFRERIAIVQPLMIGKSQKEGLNMLMKYSSEGIAEAGLCAYAFNFDLGFYEMRNVLEMASNIGYIQSSNAYRTSRKSFTAIDQARCEAVKYRALGNPTFLELPFVGMMELLLNIRLYCMSVLGKQSGVSASMNYHQVTLE